MSAESPAVALDPLVGRSRDIAAVEAALATARLVTITGLGGAGKTRLALEVLRRAAARGRTTWFVDLSHISDPAAVPGAIAVALGVGDDADADLLSAIAREASRGQTLLVLDNLEQVVEARRFVVDLLVRAAPLRILATSRVSLGVKGERVVQLDPLAVPATPDDVESSDAGRLFLARARDHGRLRSLTDADREALVEVCRRLDGLPLALELGASWTRLLSPQAIRKRLEEGRLTLAGDDAAAGTRPWGPLSSRPSALSVPWIGRCSARSRCSPAGSTSRPRPPRAASRTCCRTCVAWRQCPCCASQANKIANLVSPSSRRSAAWPQLPSSELGTTSRSAAAMPTTSQPGPRIGWNRYGDQAIGGRGQPSKPSCRTCSRPMPSPREPVTRWSR